jgi:hypothetical protein
MTGKMQMSSPKPVFLSPKADLFPVPAKTMDILISAAKVTQPK